ncbi:MULTISPECIES: hypothetical protein [unclassified Exiguobacterium]|uniref:hypothetical protein n=1 Tax=unclassified Exiguobacterium TaxID=2644629 RepID=UPI001BE8E220|nr:MULTISPECIES: hypothetical protein [unclassified Exiguobacterium]
MTQTIDIHTPEFQRTFLEMMLLAELTDEYNVAAIDALATRGETAFPNDPFFPAMRAYPHIRDGNIAKAKQWLDTVSELGDHYILHMLNGIVSEDTGFTFEAEQHFIRGVELYPDVPIMHRAIAIHYFDRKFYGEAGLHVMHYVRLAGLGPDTVPMLLEFFQVYDDIPLDMVNELMKTASGYLNANPHNPHAHSLYAAICSQRFAALSAELADEEPLTEEMIWMLLEVENHGMWSATYDQSEGHMFRHMFAEYVNNVVLPNTSQLYVWRLRIRYWTRRLTHRFTGGYTVQSS